MLLSVRSVAQLGLILVILPALAQFLLVKVRLAPLAKDVWMARGSIIVLILGAFVIGLAASPAWLVVGLVLFALGSGFSASAKSLLAAVAKGHDVGMLYTTVSFVEMSGLLIASPLLAASFRIGMELGGGWVGLPFIAAGGLFTLAAVIMMGMSFSDAGKKDYFSPSHCNVFPDEGDQSRWSHQ